MLPQKEGENYSREEYLEIEERAEYKSEYRKGQIFAMTKDSYSHNVILGNFLAALNQAFKDDERVVLSHIRLFIEEADFFVYPDVMVINGKPDFFDGRNDTIKNPILIAEILSDTSKNYDRGEKFEFYRKIETLLDYLLLDQERGHVEYFHKIKNNQWLLKEFDSVHEELHLLSIDLKISLDAIYDKVLLLENQIR